MDYSETYDFIKYEKEYLIRESYMDTLGHMNNASYIRLLEEARWDLIEERGYGLKTVMSEKISPIVLEINIKFSREILNRDTIKVQTQVSEYRGKVGNIRQQIFKEGELACTADFKFGLFDLKSRKLINATDKWLNAIGQKRQ
ncbi:MAG: thioesterase [Bdellovibrionaceae bacterium]|nr:thioesterase [Pseudobdellovibrionaceae bacterium]|tara:strand:+ start:19443 stop:19871 length:429 start_codon:yes stop_codon:yes gene_type:complete